MEIRGKQKRRKRYQQIMAILQLILFAGILALTAFLAWQMLREEKAPQTENNNLFESQKDDATDFGKKTETVLETETETEPKATVTLSMDASGLHSKNAVLIREKTGEILLDKGADEQIYPASMTKIMTAMVVLENIEDLQTKVRLPEEMFEQLYLEEASMAGFLPGEEVSVLDLLYGVMLPSGAECCTGLAQYLAGSEEGFAEMMNQKADEIGMENTHFVNASGLHDPEHVTTVSDMAKLLKYALENEVFCEISSSAVHTSEPDSWLPEGITLYSTLFGYMPQEIRDAGWIKGGKTGYTDEAGQCLASYGESQGERYLLVTAGAPGNHETEPFHILDAYHAYKNITLNEQDKD